MASRAIRWASAWHKPALSAVTMACLAWTWRGQAQRLWTSISALVHRHVLRSRPATHNGTDLSVSLLNAQLPHSSDVKTIGIQTMQTAILFMPAHFPSSPMCRIDLLSLTQWLNGSANQPARTNRNGGRQGQNRGQPFSGNCFLCGKPGHRALECPSHGKL